MDVLYALLITALAFVLTGYALWTLNKRSWGVATIFAVLAVLGAFVAVNAWKAIPSSQETAARQHAEQRHIEWAKPLAATIEGSSLLKLQPKGDLTETVKFTGLAQADVRVVFPRSSKPTTIHAWYVAGRWEYGCRYPDGRRYPFRRTPDLVGQVNSSMQCPPLFWPNWYK